MKEITIVLVSFNRREMLEESIKWLENMEEAFNIVIVDNGSEDLTSEWLSKHQYDYIWFDEGVQGYGKLWNAVLDNFELTDFVVFMEAGVYPEKNCFAKIVETLESSQVGIVSPVSNHYMHENNDTIKNKYDFEKFEQYDKGGYSYLENRKVYSANWKMFAIRKSVIETYGKFNEELENPVKVLLDYELRLIKQGLYQMVCSEAHAFEEFNSCDEIYQNAKVWEINDRKTLKDIWKMNYFNLRPNVRLVENIQEEPEKEFKVLEIGCDLGATLLEIQNIYPNCKIYGMDINLAAIDIAKNIADVRYGNIDDLTIPFTEKFDYIIFGDVLEHLRHPEEVIQMCRDILNEDGFIIASIPNIMHISIMEQLIEGRFVYTDTGLLDRTHIHFFTYYEIMFMFQRANYNVINIEASNVRITEKQKNIEKQLLSLSQNTEAWMYEVFQYIVKAQKI